MIDPTETDLLLLEQVPTMTERIGQIGAHESTHATDKTAMSRMVGSERAENRAREVEMRVICQTLRPIQPPLPIIIRK